MHIAYCIQFIDIESYSSYLKILEAILTHISERLLHITLDCCYISHWTLVRHLIAISAALAAPQASRIKKSGVGLRGGEAGRGGSRRGSSVQGDQ
eukprot:scaffold5686_cov45-Phaeocystis_antarctica.AAC.2